MEQFVPDDLVARLQERITQAIEKIRSLQETVQLLEEEEASQRQKVVTLQDRITEQESEIGRLKHLEEENAQIVERHQSLTVQLRSLVSHLEQGLQD